MERCIGWSLSILILGFCVSAPALSQTISDGSTTSTARGSRGEIFAAAAQSLVGSSGSATASLPIEFPRGSGGATPSASLTYSSSNRGDSWVGYGWSLAFGAVSRSLREGVPSYTTADTFVLNGQDLVPDGSDPDRFHTRIESFSRVQFVDDQNGGYWLVLSPDGGSSRFGSTDAARLRNSAGEVFSWHLDQTRDAHGNITTFSYQTPTGSVGILYPDEIRYTLRDDGSGALVSLNGATPPQATVDRVVSFALETRPDPSVAYITGFNRTLGHRLSDVQVSINGLVRMYRLEYGAPSSDSRRSLLREFREYGTDGLAATPTPPRVTKFNYSSSIDSGTAGWETPSWSFVSGVFFVDTAELDDGTRLADINGDGRPDLIRENRLSTNHNGTYLGEPGGFTASGAHRVPKDPDGTRHAFVANHFQTFGRSSQGMVLTDLNRDGRADVLVMRSLGLATDGGFEHRSWIDRLHRTATGWTRVFDGWPTIKSGVAFREDSIRGYSFVHQHIVISTLGNASQVMSGRTALGDLNGDGRPDFITKAEINNSFEKSFIRNTGDSGSGFGALESSPYRICSGSGNSCLAKAALVSFTTNSVLFTAAWELGKIFVDVNGDGLTDHLVGWKTKNGTNWLRAYINNGSDFVESPNWAPPTVAFKTESDDSSKDKGVRFIDVNGDGRLDIVRRDDGADALWINSGDPADPWIPSTDWPGSDAWKIPSSHRFVGSSAKDRGVRIADLDGDGLTDLIQLREGSTKSIRLNSGTVPDLLVSSESPLGAIETFRYTSSANFDNTGIDSEPDLPMVLQVVDQATLDDANGNVSTTDISYEGGMFDGQERSFLGFRKVTETRAIDGRKTITEYWQTVARAGQPISNQVEDASGNVWARSEWEYTSTASPFVTLPVVHRFFEYDGQATPRVSLTKFEYDGTGNASGPFTFGNRTSMIEFGEVDTQDADVDGSDNRRLDFVYTPPLDSQTALLSNLVGTRISRSGSGATDPILAQTDYFYDDTDGTVPVSRGTLTRLKRHDSPGAPIEALMTYDQFGNEISKTRPRVVAEQRNASITTTYDELGAFVESTTNELGHKTETRYSLPQYCGNSPAGAGLPHEIAGLNDDLASAVRTLRCYGVFGRPVLEVAPATLHFKTTVSAKFAPDLEDAADVAQELATRGGSTSLFRAVGPGELADVQRLGRFRNPAGSEVKFFSTAEGGASSFARQSSRAFGDGPFTILETRIPTRAITPGMRAVVDRGIDTVVVPTRALDLLGNPRILPSAVIPK